MIISHVELWHNKIPLTIPYVLSFMTVEAIDNVVVKIVLENGSEGYGEVVPLHGYSDESIESLYNDLGHIMKSIPGLDHANLEEYLLEKLPYSPFANSALITAKEMAVGEIKCPDVVDIPLVAAISSNKDPDIALSRALELYDSGYRTIKVKVGRDINDDYSTIIRLLDELKDDSLIRIDANQAYNMIEAKKIMSCFEHERFELIELIEQPFGSNEWDLFEQLVSLYPNVPLMLDESITKDSDVDRASKVGAKLVKLKLCKHRGLHGLLSMAMHANKLGMKVVLGNGVSAALGNLIEAIAYVNSKLFTGACEANGFEKLILQSMDNSPLVENGRMIWRNSGDSISELISLDEYKLIYSKSL